MWLLSGAIVIAAGAIFGSAAAQNATPSSQEIVKGLAGKPGTRSLTRSLDSTDKTFIAGLPTTRGLQLDQREELEKIVERHKLPSIDIRIDFDHDSAALTDAAKQSINQLGQALLSPELKDARIALNGHTDASGTNPYNQALSERRAVSVQEYLVSTFDIDRGNLVVAGFGEDRLKDPNDPEGAINRRVEVINLTSI